MKSFPTNKECEFPVQSFKKAFKKVSKNLFEIEILMNNMGYEVDSKMQKMGYEKTRTKFDWKLEDLELEKTC
jgi:NADP-dependent 3-hydroxy acid dehydrogenase YdfG